jgi:hypothetical protein
MGDYRPTWTSSTDPAQDALELVCSPEEQAVINAAIRWRNSDAGRSSQTFAEAKLRLAVDRLLSIPDSAAEQATPAPQDTDTVESLRQQLAKSRENFTEYVNGEFPRPVGLSADPAKVRAHCERVARIHGQDPAVGAMVAHILSTLDVPVPVRYGGVPDAP